MDAVAFGMMALGALAWYLWHYRPGYEVREEARRIAWEVLEARQKRARWEARQRERAGWSLAERDAYDRVVAEHEAQRERDEEASWAERKGSAGAR